MMPVLINGNCCLSEKEVKDGLLFETSVIESDEERRHKLRYNIDRLSMSPGVINLCVCV